MAVGLAILAFALMNWSELTAKVLLRLWLLGGAVYAMKNASLLAAEDEERVSTFGLLVFIAGTLLVGLVIGGSVLNLLGED